MDGARWERIQALFHHAADLTATEQRDYLRAECGDDPPLMQDVLALLEADRGGNSILDQGIARVANHVLGEAVPSALSSQEFGPYRICKVLGEGGMGVVYLAERKDLGSLVAIKILRDAWLSPSRRERFASEQRTLAQLNHPAIARLYDADSLADGTPCFIMEYVEGEPLTECCSAHQTPVRARLQLLRAVCEAVQYAHSNAVIHRDLKPSNILVKNDGSVRLLDFGIAKQLETLDGPLAQKTSEPTMTGMRLMTPAYAAPEQIRGERVGIQTDVYSLGVILYELLAGRRPFDLSNLTPTEALTVLLEHEPERPSSAARQSAGSRSHALTQAEWADLDVLCFTAMHRDPGRRYQSVEALIRDIDRFLKGEPLEARGDTWRYRLGKFVTRNRQAVVAASLVLAVVIGLVVFFTVRLATARNEALAEAARAQRIQNFMLNLFRGNDEAAGPADNLRVVTLLDRGVQQAQSLGAEPEAQAELFETLGSIYQKLAKFDQSEAMLNSALQARTKLFGSNSVEAAGSLVALGLLRNDQARYDDAEKLVRQGLGMTLQAAPSNQLLLGKATFALGRVLVNRGKYVDAIEVLNRAAQLQSSPEGATTDLAASLSDLANAHFYLGHYDTSDALNRRVLEMNRQLYCDRHPQVADTLVNLGAIQFQLGHYVESEKFNRQALEIVEAWYGKEHPETADTMTILGQSLAFQQRYDDAAALLQESLAILEKDYGAVHPRVAFALMELGNIAIRQQKLDSAEAYFRRAMGIYKSVYGDHHYLVGLAESNLGGVYTERKDYATAEKFFRQALEMYVKTLPPKHLNVGITEIRLGNALAGAQHFAEAREQSLAGYEILSGQSNPPGRWMQMARKDLATEYEAMKEPDKAARFRTELASAAAKAPASSR